MHLEQANTKCHGDMSDPQWVKHFLNINKKCNSRKKMYVSYKQNEPKGGILSLLYTLL